jgi:truncated hemoglobin YjbI
MTTVNSKLNQGKFTQTLFLMKVAMVDLIVPVEQRGVLLDNIQSVPVPNADPLIRNA